MYTKEFIHTQNKKIQAHTPIFNLNEEILMTLERIEQSRLTDLTIKALQTYGLSEPDARSTAEILVLADMFGLQDRKSVVSGKRVSVRVDIGVRRRINKSDESNIQFNHLSN